MKRHTESFVNELRFEASPLPSFYNMIPRGEFPDGQGTVLSTFLIGRSLPTTDLPEFSPVTTSLTADNCATTWNDVPVGFSEKTFRPEAFGWQGPVICQDNLIYDWNRNRFLDAYLRAMKKNVRWTIENRLAAIYDHYVPKAVAAENLEFTGIGTGFPGQTPDLSALAHTECDITQEMLDETAAILIEEGADEGPFDDGWITFGPNGPIFTLQIGLRASAHILKRNAELRQDYRWAEATKGEEGSSIIRRLGASKVIGNFRHLVVSHPSRANWVPGTGLVRVNTWVNDPTVTQGDAVMVNPEWLSADFEAVRVMSPNVFKDLIVRPINSAGGGTSWKPKSYMGEWQFVTGGNKIGTTHCLDPLEKYGRHYAEYKHAPEPVSPKHGRTIWFRRCTTTSECIRCAC